MKNALAAVCALLTIAAFTPSASAVAVHMAPPDPARGTIGVRVKLALRGKMAGATAGAIYFVRVTEDSDPLTAEQLIPANYGKGRNLYLLNAEPGRYVAVGGEFQLPPTTMRGVTLFSKADIPKTEITVRAGSVAFMGEIDAGSAVKMLELDETQAHFLHLIFATSDKLGAADRTVTVNFAQSSVIRTIERGEAVDTEFWSEATHNHFRNEPAWIKLIDSRPVLPPQIPNAPAKSGGGAPR